jgi:putative phosphoribosyl transferase
MSVPAFTDRIDAGRRLGDLLVLRLDPADRSGMVVVGLPRGGVPVAREVARRLGAPLDVAIVRKLGAPRQPELAVGAIGEGNVRVLNDDVLAAVGVTAGELADIESRERVELARRVERYRRGRRPLPVAGRTALVVDDGIATGASARAAMQVMRARGAAKVLFAAPVGPCDAAARLADVADEVVLVEQPRAFRAVGAHYDDFSPTTDDEVITALAERPALERDVRIAVGSVSVHGCLVVPAGAFGLVVFAHGSGSSRHSPRNRAVAGALQARGVATLLADLLMPAEADDRRCVFDIELLGTRVAGLCDAMRAIDATADLPIGLFGASTGAAAALWVAARPDSKIAAVVSRGGRPDLARPWLADVGAPTLLIVGGDDREVVAWNRAAADALRCEHAVAIVPGAGHLFEEPGTLDEVAILAGDWFDRWLHAA